MKYATIRHGAGSLAGLVDGDMFRPFIPAMPDIAAAIPRLLHGLPELGAPIRLADVSIPFQKPCRWRRAM
jgi:hypothetical protein